MAIASKLPIVPAVVKNAYERWAPKTWDIKPDVFS